MDNILLCSSERWEGRTVLLLISAGTSLLSLPDNVTPVTGIGEETHRTEGTLNDMWNSLVDSTGPPDLLLLC